MRYRLDEAGWRALIDRARHNDWRGQIVGAHGSGKTTLLEELERRLRQAGIATHRITPHDWDRALPPVDVVPSRGATRKLHLNDAVVLCDGAEQLSALDALRLRWRARSARGLIVTVHRAARWGPVLHSCETSPALLQDIVGTLGQSMSPGEAATLYERHRGDLRLALRELYDGA